MPPAAPATDRHEPERIVSRAAAAVAVAPLAVLLAARPAWTPALSLATWLPGHALVEVMVVALAFATFAVQWFAAGAGVFHESRARFVGAALFAAALFEALHILAFPGMPAFLGPASTERGIYYWLAARIWTVGALLAAIRPPDLRPFRRGALLAANVAAVGAVVTADLLLPDDAALFFVEGRGLTPLKVALEAAVAGLAAVGAVAYARRARAAQDPALAGIARALAVTILSELCFMSYRTASDAFNVLGHVYLLVSAWLLFEALFVAAVVRPHRDLQRLRRHVEGELAQTIVRLEDATEQRDDVLRAVTHDLRNPLQVVLLQAQRLAGDAEEAVRRRGEAILGAARRMEAMLRELVESARAESAAATLRARPVPLRPFVDAVLGASAGALDVRRVVNRVPDDLPPVLADPDRLDRILVNLVGNALAYSDAAVVIRAEHDGDGGIRIAVADRGPGIPPEQLPRVFDRFQRGGRRDGEGLGLGLFIVRKLVEAHGGTIRVDSTPGDGSTFTFTLGRAPGA